MMTDKNDSPLTSPPSVRFKTTDAKIVTQGFLVQVLSVLLLLAFLLIILPPAAPPRELHAGMMAANVTPVAVFATKNEIQNKRSAQ